MSSEDEVEKLVLGVVLVASLIGIIWMLVELILYFLFSVSVKETCYGVNAGYLCLPLNHT